MALKPAVGNKAKVKVFVLDGGDAGVIVGGDVDAFETEEEDLCEVDIVEGVGDMDLVLE